MYALPQADSLTQATGASPEAGMPMDSRGAPRCDGSGELGLGAAGVPGRKKKANKICATAKVAHSTHSGSASTTDDEAGSPPSTGTASTPRHGKIRTKAAPATSSSCQGALAAAAVINEDLWSGEMDFERLHEEVRKQFSTVASSVASEAEESVDAPCYIHPNSLLSDPFKARPAPTMGGAPTLDTSPKAHNKVSSFNRGLDTRSQTSETIESWPEGITTVMLKSIACRHTQSDVVDILNEAGLFGKFDLVHVPWGSARASNLGYCFVNFLTPECALECVRLCDGKPFGTSATAKVCQVVPAHVQGSFLTTLSSKKKKKSGKNVMKASPLIVDTRHSIGVTEWSL